MRGASDAETALAPTPLPARLEPCVAGERRPQMDEGSGDGEASQSRDSAE